MQKNIPKINEDNEVLGETTIEEAVEKGWYRRAVRVFIFSTDGQILLQQRSFTITGYPCLWDQAAGGHIDVGESAYEAAVRETKEEIGLELELTEVTGPIKSETDKERIFSYAYKAVINSNVNITIDTADLERVQWFTVGELEQQLVDKPESFIPAFDEFWQKHRDTLIGI